MTNLIFSSSVSSSRQSVAMLIGRLALGVVLIAHGWQKFFTYGISGATASFEQMGIPAAGAAAVFAATVELVGGILLIVGFAVPLVGLLVALDMAGALIFVHAANGVFVDAGGYELVLVIGALGVVFAGLGAGSYSIDRLLGGNRAAPAARDRADLTV